MNSIALGRYIPYNSFIHRLDPRSKIINMMILLVLVIINPIGFIGYAILGTLMVIMLIISHLSLGYLWKSVKPMLFMMSFLMIINLFLLRTGEVLFSIGGFDIYSGAVFQTIYIGIRIVLMIGITTILTATTKPLDLTLGIEDLLTPLKKIKVPAHEIAMMISLALRFIPTLIEEAERIMKAQASRGVDFKEGSLKDKVIAIGTMIIPLFISSLQRAEDVANAMESRGYVPDQKRTRYRELEWKSRDTISMIVIVLMTIAMFGSTWI